MPPLMTRVKTNRNNNLLINFITSINSIAYPTVGHYYKSSTWTSYTCKDSPFIWQSQILLRLEGHPTSTDILAELLQVPMACQTSWLKKAWNSPIESRSPFLKDQRISQDTLRLTKRDLNPSISLHSPFLASSKRSLLYFLKPRKKTVQHCSAWWASASMRLVSQSGPTLWVNDAPKICTSLTSASGTTLRQLLGSQTFATD